MKMTSREKVLTLLQKNSEKFISGQMIADELSLSRNSVWKAINGLRKEGYAIEAVTNKGYRLNPGRDGSVGRGSDESLSLEAIRQYLPANVNTEQIHVYDSVTSTNRLAKSLALSGAPHGTVVLANQQTEGQAHHRESFLSPKGGIYFSIILRPEEVRIKEPDVLVKAIAVGICEAIEEVADKKMTIHGINDIFSGENKVAGTLNESVNDIENGEIQWVVSGTGIHFSEKQESFPKSAHPSLSSLFPDGHAACSRNQLAAEAIRKILAECGKRNGDVESSYRKWHI